MAKEKNGANAYGLAYEKIKEMLFDFSIKPGEYISELMISKELGISRTPIREAMRTLEQEGVIISINGRKKAPSFSFEDLQQIFELKLAIECSTILHAVNRQTVIQRKKMIEIKNEIKSLSDRLERDGNTQEIFLEWDKVDQKFHSLLFEMSGNMKAKDIVDKLNLQWHRFKIGLTAREHRLEENISEHYEIACLVILNKAEDAKDKLELHMEKLYDELLLASNNLISF